MAVGIGVVLMVLPLFWLMRQYRHHVVPKGYYRDVQGREWENRDWDI